MTYTAEQQAEHRKLWVEALRSGKFTQGQGALRKANGGMCCLGVACDISGLVEWQSIGNFGYEPVINGTPMPRFYTPDEVREWLGLGSFAGSFVRNEKTDSLASLNDDGKSFAEIADVIEAEPEGLLAK